ncbi:MAG: tRNA (adenosine(37)-N6)-threonylcarbamoyltransferase complex dimerization subunit type 1 TsaB [Propionibacteriaceae bacterium]|nr:tRNA (adenosine(37)-N6)-threonylcarbamoyltransferase complex dimerization subunit type 1 TsaB [Propionibacteriaceae bacterium]
MSEVVLGIDTSTQVCVGVARDGEVLLSTSVGDSRSHVELLMPAVRDLLDEACLSMADLTRIAVGMGPGPFTGLRVGVVAAQMLAHTRGLPVSHLCSLDALGVGWALTHPAGDFVACTDARRKEVYWATYDRFGQRTAGPFVSDPSDVPDLPCVGPGVVVYPHMRMDPFLAIKLGLWTDQFASSWPTPEEVAPIVGVDAGVLAAFASQLPDVGPEPLYLRHADATRPGSVKSVLPSTTPESSRDGR